MKEKDRSRYLDLFMGLLGVLAVVGIIVMYLYGVARYRGFFIKECGQIKSTFEVSWGEQKIQTALPGTISNPDMEPVLIKTVLHKEELGDGDSILFRSRQSGVKVSLDGETVYDSGPAYNYPFLLGYGSFWKSIKLGENYDGKTLTIELEPGYEMQAVSGYLPEIYFGTQAAFMVMILRNVFWYLLLILFLIALGISVLLYGLALIHKNESHPLIVLGLFSIDTGLWMLIEAHVLELFADNTSVILYLSYLTYGIMPVLLVRFLLCYKEFKTKKYLRLLYLVGIVLNMIQLLLVMTGICSEFESQGLNRVYLGLTVIGLLAALTSIREVEKERRKLYSGIFILAVSAVCELGYFFLVNKKNSGRILMVGICLFIVKSGVDLLREIKRIQKTDIERDVLIKMAYQDGLTHLGNRYAYEREKSRLEEDSDTHVTILIAEMDGLKGLNDRHGHLYGDQIISRTAEILAESFRDIGQCFRIGGSEFCVLAENTKRSLFETGICRMEENISALKDNIEGYGITYGVAEGVSKETEDIFHIADNLMYARKKDMRRTENELVKS